ncbi:MAG: hypothetical protein DMF26_09090 [Verrucomicrobia bacterium]|nr:MAG: hypothetical protein DMF26_09090 [Verrucomicrobiota bacterium]
MTQPLVCTIRDQKRLQREFELLSADAFDPKQQAEELCERFQHAIRRYPADWTVESRRSSEHVWTFGKAQVRYRIVPDAEAVEILSVSTLDAGEQTR